MIIDVFRSDGFPLKSTQVGGFIINIDMVNLSDNDWVDPQVDDNDVWGFGPEMRQQGGRDIPIIRSEVIVVKVPAGFVTSSIFL